MHYAYCDRAMLHFNLICKQVCIDIVYAKAFVKLCILNTLPKYCQDFYYAATSFPLYDDLGGYG